jgi:hypothetical protein
MFGMMEEYTLKKTVTELSSKGITAHVIINSVNTYVDYFTKKNVTT